MSRRPGKRVIPGSLREVYTHRGDFSAKMHLDPETSVWADTVDIEVRNADGKPMQFNFRRWGTKLNLSFSVTSETPDGLAVVDITLRNVRDNEVSRERLSFWVVKE